MCIMHMMPGPSCDGEFIHSFNTANIVEGHEPVATAPAAATALWQGVRGSTPRSSLCIPGVRPFNCGQGKCTVALQPLSPSIIEDEA
jgi:hypothetical protein